MGEEKEMRKVNGTYTYVCQDCGSFTEVVIDSTKTSEPVLAKMVADLLYNTCFDCGSVDVVCTREE